MEDKEDHEENENVGEDGVDVSPIVILLVVVVGRARQT